MRRLPPLNALRAFEAAARHGSFAAAAEELSVTPTAISHQIRTLEDYLGQALFRRRPRPVVLTDAGRRLYPVLRDGFDRFAVALQELQGAGPEAPLVVTTTPAFASRWLLPRLADLRARLGDVALDVRTSVTPENLREADADFAIRYAASPTDDLVWHELFRDRFIPVATPDWLPPGRHRLTVDELRERPLIHYPWKNPNPRAPSWDRWFAAAGAAGNAPQGGGGFVFSDESHALQAVLAGHGVGLASDRLVVDAMATGALVQVHDAAVAGFAYHAVHVPGAPREGLVREVVAWAREQSASSQGAADDGVGRSGRHRSD